MRLCNKSEREENATDPSDLDIWADLPWQNAARIGFAGAALKPQDFPVKLKDSSTLEQLFLQQAYTG